MANVSFERIPNRKNSEFRFAFVFKKRIAAKSRRAPAYVCAYKLVQEAFYAARNNRSTCIRLCETLNLYAFKERDEKARGR